MRLRSLLIVIAIIVAGAAGVVGWDALKLDRTVPLPVPADSRATSILIEKQARRLTLFKNDAALKTYAVSLGGDPIGQKQQEGDKRTPEGRYAIDFKHPKSRFHLALRISYPNDEDRTRARRRKTAPGGDIMIHGLPNGIGWLGGLALQRDWTDGCVAVTNAQIEEIWSMVDVGTAVEIRP
jgi:murein L,D-transpeptidase YafK